MRWFKKWINRMNNEGRDYWEEDEIHTIASDSGTPYHKNPKRLSAAIRGQAIPSSNSPNTHSINFQIYPATGGYVAEISFYDEKTDNNVRSLHVIPTTDYSQLGDSISKIITLEMLKR